MQLSRTIDDGFLKFVETNVFIYVITAHPNFGKIAKEILTRIEKGEPAVTSTLAIAEVCAWLEYHKMKNKIPTFFEALESYPSLKKIETTYEDMLKAAELADRYRPLEFFDRVYLAQMLKAGIIEIYSNDRGFDRVPAVKRVFE